MIPKMSDSPNINNIKSKSERLPAQVSSDHNTSLPMATAGRIALGGRTLVNPGDHGNRHNTSGASNERGNNAIPQQQHLINHMHHFRGGATSSGGRTTINQPIQIHQHSGIPFGHVPAYLPGSASLVEQLDQTILIVLRDGKHLIGTLSSFDQFSNLVLRDAFERHMVTIPNANDNGFRYYYSDVPLGIYVVRGDSMVLAGDVDDNNLQVMEKVSILQLKEMRKHAIAELNWDFDTDLTA